MLKYKRLYKYKTRYIQHLFKVLCWIRRFLINGDEESPEKNPSLPTCHKLFGPLLRKMDNVLHARGPMALIKYIKEVRRLYLCYLSGNISTSSTVKTTKDGIPIVLGDLIPDIRRGVNSSNIRTTRLLTTCLFSTRSLKARNPMDINPIEAPGSGDPETAFQVSEYSTDF
jgi:hypothetical protein